jgi:hypothetical protein
MLFVVEFFPVAVVEGLRVDAHVCGGATNEYGPATASVRPAEMTYHLFMR